MDIIEADIKGVQEALKNLTDAGAIDPVIKATVMLSESGFASVQEVVAFGEIKDDSIAGKIKGLFGAGSSASAEAESERETQARSETASESASAASESAEPTASEVPEKKEKPKDTITLELEVKLSSVPPMSVAEKRTARDRCVGGRSYR